MFLLPLHVGDLHAYEALLLGLLAFGPFVVAAVVVIVIRRRDIASGRAADQGRPDVRRPGGDGS